MNFRRRDFFQGAAASGALAVSRKARRPGLSGPAGPHPRRARGRRPDRCRGPHHRGMAFAEVRPAVHRREPHRHGRQSREPGADQLSPGRLHPAVLRADLDHQRLALQEAAVQLRARHRPGRRGDALPEPDGGADVAAGHECRRVHRLCQSPSRRAVARLLGRRRIAASLRRALQVHGEGRPGARALSRLGRRLSGPDDRQGPRAVRQPRRPDPRARARRQAARARRHHRQALAADARHPRHRRDRARLSGRHLVRHVCAEERRRRRSSRRSTRP